MFPNEEHKLWDGKERRNGRERHRCCRISIASNLIGWSPRLTQQRNSEYGDHRADMDVHR